MGMRLFTRLCCLTALSLFPLLTACKPAGGDLSQPAPSTSPEPAPDTAFFTLDQGRMMADIEFLADDQRNGRFTLNEDLKLSVDYLVARYQQLGIAPLGDSYLHTYKLVTGVSAVAPPQLAFTVGKRSKKVDAKHIAPLAPSGTGEVTAPVVFVGYAAKAEAVPGKPGDPESGIPETPGRPAYDDLAGVDVKGKIAMVLLDSPGRPSLREVFRVLQEINAEFEKRVGPLKQAKDVPGLKKLHADIHAKLVGLLSPMLPGVDVAKILWPLPEDPMSLGLSLQQDVFAPVMAKAADIPGPQFGMETGQLGAKLKRLRKAGAVGVIAVRGPRSFVDDKTRKEDKLPDLGKTRTREVTQDTPLPVVQMQWKAADRYLRPAKVSLTGLQKTIDTKLEPQSKALNFEATLATSMATKTIEVPNVVATIPGSENPDEIVVIGAHYDHIGTDGENGHCKPIEDDKICNGADDNASGTAMVLELARAFAQHNPKPKRTLVFTHFSGEELGLYGSRAMVRNPPFDLKSVVAMVNLDMVGRLGRRGLAIGGIHSSEQWMPLLDELGNRDMTVIYEGSVTSRSDHAGFFKRNIPVLFFFTGIHGDYHRAGDHADKVNIQGMEAIGEIVSGVMLALGNGYPLTFSKPGKNGGISQGLPG
ncbi:MAG: M20/M25/M40 family metallo-hydrolase, partial [Nannocystaceae bacterium]